MPYAPARPQPQRKSVGTVVGRLCAVALGCIAIASLALCGIGPASRALAYPEPSVYPISWELDFTHGTPKRIVVEVPGSDVPKAFWYITYNVVNKTDREQMFLPVFEMMLRDGSVIRSDNNIPAKVFDRIKQREQIKYLEPFPQVSGLLRIGDDEAKDGVAIWPEVDRRMGSFSIFVQGLSGEMAPLKDEKGNIENDSDGNPIFLRKTLEVDYLSRSDGMYNSAQNPTEASHEWVMR